MRQIKSKIIFRANYSGNSYALIERQTRYDTGCKPVLILAEEREDASGNGYWAPIFQAHPDSKISSDILLNIMKAAYYEGENYGKGIP